MACSRAAGLSAAGDSSNFFTRRGSYLASLVKNEFALTGAPTQVLVPSRDAPLEGKIVAETELFFGHSRRPGSRVNWRVQLNIRNLLDRRDRMEQRANVGAGYTTVYAVPEPRSFILTNTFSQPGEAGTKRFTGKLEIRSSKFETNPKPEEPKTGATPALRLEFSAFALRVCFEFRHSCFEFQNLAHFARDFTGK